MARLSKAQRQQQQANMLAAPPEVHLTQPGFRSGGYAGSFPFRMGRQPVQDLEMTTRPPPPPPPMVAPRQPDSRKFHQKRPRSKIAGLIGACLTIGLIYFLASRGNTCQFGYSPDAIYCRGNETEIQYSSNTTLHKSPFGEHKKHYSAWIPEEDFSTIYACEWRSEREGLEDPWLCQKASCKDDWVVGDKCKGFKHVCKNGGQRGDSWSTLVAPPMVFVSSGEE